MLKLLDEDEEEDDDEVCDEIKQLDEKKMTKNVKSFAERSLFDIF
jgi:hypothetical protein